MKALVCLILSLNLMVLFATRANSMEFTLGLRAGLPVNPVPSLGVETFLHFQDFSIGLSHMTSELSPKMTAGYDFSGYDISDDIDDGTDETHVDKVIATASMSLLEVRYFLFWGLNGTVGIGQRKMGLEFDINETDNISRLQGKLVARTLVVSHTVGVEWHFGWWYFSADGVGYAYPISTKSESEVEASGNLSGDLGQVDEDLQKAADEMGHVITKQLFLVSFGLLH
jgi:hypothetical protein